MRNKIALLLTLVLCLSLAACGQQTPAAQTPAVQTPEDVVILHTNDVHTYIDGPLSYDVVAALKQELEKQYGTGNVLLADAGDHIQGTAYGAMDAGMTMIALMNGARYDVATLGNHEFDYGMEGAMAAVEAADFTYLSCNFFHEKEGVRQQDVLDAYKIFQTPGGLRVAFVGITTPESITKSTPAYFQDEAGSYVYGISGGRAGGDLQADVQAAIDALEELEVDVIIGLGHLGNDPASSPWTSAETIAGVSGLDAFIDGHSHTVINETVADRVGAPVALVQTGSYFDGIGMLVIDGETGAITTDLITYSPITQVKTDETGAPVLDDWGQEITEVLGYELGSRLYTGEVWCSDAAVSAAKDAWITEIDTQLGETIGEAAVTLDNYDAAGSRLVRSQETNTGDFTADALYWVFDDMGLEVDVAVMNGGGIRNKAVTGTLTYQTAKAIHTFGNVACLQTVTGQQLLDALEWGARSVGIEGENGSFLQVSGITYRINSKWPASVQADDKGVWTGGPTGGYRVQDVMIYNKETQAYEPLDLTASYNLAGYNYTLRDLGDGFNMFSGAVNVLDYVMEDYMVLAAYIQAFEGGVVEGTNSPLADRYPGMLLDYSTVSGSGRIIIE